MPSLDLAELRTLLEKERGATALLEHATKLSAVYVWSFEIVDGGIANAPATFFNVWESLGYETPPPASDFAEAVRLVVVPEDHATVNEAVTRCLRGETEGFEEKYRVRHGDGSIHWNLGRGIVTRDDSGKPVRFLGTSVDITDLAHAEEALRASEKALVQANDRLELGLRSGTLGIFDIDMPGGDIRGGRRTLFNVWEPLGYEVPPLHGDEASIMLPEDRAALGKHMSDYLNGVSPAYETEHRVVHRDGSIQWRLARGLVLRDGAGTATRFVGSLVDVTAMKRIETELLAARAAAEAANRAKDEFLANVSHEIRTPMNAILGMTEIAIEDAESPRQARLLGTVEAAAKNLLGLIDDLLDFSKMSAGMTTLEEAPFSLRGVLEETLGALAARAKRKGLALRCHVEPGLSDTVLGDLGRVRQVLMNIVGNAIKFTEHGEIVVMVANASTPGMLRFAVRDTGVGIASEKRASIFRAFEQADASTTRKYGGTGLGLTIAAQLLALMGGTLEVESELGKGSTFVFTASLASAPEHALPNGPSWTDSSAATISEEMPKRRVERVATVAKSPRAERILVAEDNEMNVALMTELLERRGYVAEVVGDGRRALTLATERTFDLLLLDLHMPSLDGFEVAKAIRAREKESGRHLPILALTARSTSRDRECALAAGMDDVLTKPIDVDRLWAAVDRLVEAFAPAKAPAKWLDGGAVARVSGGRPHVLARLSEVFLRTLPGQIERTRAALAAEDLTALGNAAHMLYGTVSAFSMLVGEKVLQLEEASIGEDAARCTALFDELDATCAALAEEVRSLLSA